MLAYVPYPTLLATLALLAIADGLLVGLPCCSPVQRLDVLTTQRRLAGVEEMRTHTEAPTRSLRRRC